MADFENEGGTALMNNEDLNPSGEQSSTGKAGKVQDSSGKGKSAQTPETRRKKEDALEGKEDNKAREAETREDEHAHSEKDAKSEEDSSQARQSLQSGQTTVQFSSGGGVGANAASALNSLLGLFASSATLVRAEIGGVLGVINQDINLNVRSFAQTFIGQGGSLFSEEIKNLKIGEVIGGQSAEAIAGKQTLDFGTIQALHSSGTSSLGFLGNILNINVSAGGSDVDEGTTPLQIFFSAPFIVLQTANFANFFFNNIPFAFTSPSTHSGQIGTYYTATGLTAPAQYSYDILSPTIITQLNSATTGPTSIEVTSNGSLFANVNTIDTPTTVPSGITLTSSGNLLVSVTQPMSILVNIHPPGSTNTALSVPVRIDAGPGDLTSLVQAPNTTGIPTMMTGLIAPSTSEFIATTFSSYGSPTIVGNAPGIFLNDNAALAANAFETPVSGVNVSIDRGSLLNFVYVEGLILDSAIIVGDFNMNSLPTPNTYVFPSSTIFRHDGTTANAVAAEPGVYGNFSEFINTNIGETAATGSPSTLSFLDSVSYNLTFGGNVLDVYGTKYGVGDILDLNLANSSNTITMGGNTLAGFGISYGDLQTLNISAGTSSPVSASATTLMFNGNLLYVDKSVSSTLYPHLQNLDLANNITQNSDINITFKDSIIHGNLGNDAFYGDIQNLGDLGNLKLYNGFITGVSVTNPEPNGDVVITPSTVANGVITQGNDSITWGNNIYTEGNSASQPGFTNMNTYNFTLVGAINANENPVAPKENPVMEGNAIITNFNPTTDTLIFQLTPAVFRMLDINHDKAVTGADLLAQGVQLSGLSLPTDTTLLAALPANPTGTTLTFNGGGTLTLLGVHYDSQTNSIPPITIKTEVDLSYQQVAAATPAPEQPIIISNAPFGQTTAVYYNNLDNYFTNSLYATYSVSLTPLKPQGITITNPVGPAPTQVNSAQQGATSTILTADPSSFGEVTIDPYGTILDTSMVPILTTLSITATDQQGGTATNPLLFGFLDAPTKIIPAGLEESRPTLTSATAYEVPYILQGGAGSTIIGNAGDNPEQSTGDPATFSIAATLFDTTQGMAVGPPALPPTVLGSNLIIDTAGGTVYGNFQHITMSSTGGSNMEAVISGNTVVFGVNALDIAGTYMVGGNPVQSLSYGVSQDMSITTQGGGIATLHFGNTAINIDNSAHYDSNTLIFGAQTDGGPNYIPAGGTIPVGTEVLYGSGQLFGDMSEIGIISAPGSITQTVPDPNFDSTLISNINLSSSVSNNTFDFLSTQLILQGGQPGDPSTLVGNVQTLLISSQNAYAKVESANITINTTSTFSGNQFEFGDATLQGNDGNTTYYGHLENFGDPFNYGQYNGFVDGVTVSTSTVNHENFLIITDQHNNSITWGNDIYTGGTTGSNVYNFTIVEDMSGLPVMQGFDTITNFAVPNPLNPPHLDTIVFNVEPNMILKLEAQFGLPQSTTNEGFMALALDLSGGVIVDGSENSTITFTGENGQPYGSISLPGANLGTSSLDGLIQNYPSDFQINAIGTAYAPPSLVLNPAFDPVFVNVLQPVAFAQEVVNGDPFSLSYNGNTATSITDSMTHIVTYNETPGITLDSTGTLSTVNVNGPVTTLVNLSVNDGITTSNILPVQIFAINATDGIIDRGTGTAGETVDGSTSSPLGVATLHAIETNNPGNIIIGEGGVGGKITDITAYTPTSTIPAEFGSNVIYDVSLSSAGIGHLAVGDVPTITFTDDGSGQSFAFPTITPTTLPTITFDSNILDVAAGTGGAVVGNMLQLNVTATGGTNTATIDSLQLMFNSNTIFGSGAIAGNMGTLDLSVSGGNNATSPTDANIQNSKITFAGNTISAAGTIYGNIVNLNLDITDPAVSSIPIIGNGFITGNTFNFDSNTLTGGSTATSLYAGVGTLVMADQETSAFTHVPTVIGTNLPVTSQITDNALIFENSTLTAGSGKTSFYTDIADLSNTDFVANPVILGPNNTITNIANITALGTVEVQDTLGNTITWGNDTFVGNTNGGNSYTITLLTAGTRDNPIAVMQGNLTIQHFNSSNDIVNINLTPDIFSKINSDQGFAVNYNRTMTYTELDNEFSTIPQGTANSILTFNFAGDNPTFDHGSIIFENQSVTSFSFFNPNTVITDLYTQMPITVVNANPAPIVFSSTFAVPNDPTLKGVYGNALDAYFNNIDPASINSTYSYALVLPGLTAVNASQTAYSPIDNLIFDKFGTATATAGSQNIPALSLINVTPNGASVSVNLLVGEFNGTTINDPNNVSGGVFAGSLTSSQTVPGSFLQGGYADETMIGNNGTDTGSPRTYSFSFLTTDITYANNEGTAGYGQNQFGNNMIINTNPSTVAYGDFQDIDVTFNSYTSIHTSTSDSNNSFSFGVNAFDVTGTIFGTADTFSLNVNNLFSGQSVGSTDSTLQDLSIELSGTNFNFGSKLQPGTIFGSGTIFADLNTLQINVTAGQNDTISSDADVSAKVVDNVFNFYPTQIAILDNGTSTIYTDINSLDITLINNEQNLTNPTLTGLATFTGNNFYFGNTTVFTGNGTTDIYSQINDLSNTSFWNAPVTVTSTTTDPADSSLTQKPSHVVVTDANTNAITWGNETYNLGTGMDTIHLDLLAASNGTTFIPVMQGHLIVNNFNLATDFIRFDLSAPLYNELINTGKSFTGTNVGLTLGTITVTTPAATPEVTTITFSDGGTPGNDNYGSIVLDDIGTPTLNSLGDFGNSVEFGTTVYGSYGTSGSSDTFIFTPALGDLSNFGSFSEFDNIRNFNTSADLLQIELPKGLYSDASQGGLVTGNAILTALTTSAATAAGGLVVVNTPAQFESANAVTMDSTIEFQTSGSTLGLITLNNVDITDLSGLGANLQLGSIEAAPSTGGATLSFNASPAGPDEFSSFQQFAHVLNFGLTGTNIDNLQIDLPLGLYRTISLGGQFNPIAIENGQAGDSISDGVGALFVSTKPAYYAGTVNVDTVLSFYGNSPTPSGSITLNNFDITDGGTQSAALVDFGTHLEFGSVQVGTAGTMATTGNTFIYDFPPAPYSGPDFTSFTQFDRVLNFNPAQDNLQLTIPMDIYNQINPIGALSGTSLDTALATSATTTVGGILVTNSPAQYASTVTGAASVDSTLEFVTSSGQPTGAITLNNVNIADLSGLGTHFEFGYVESGSLLSTTADTLNFVVANYTATDFSYFSQFDHITNFNSGAAHPDTIQIALPLAVFNGISQNGSVSGTALEMAIETSGNNVHSTLGGIVVGTMTDPNTGLPDTTLNFVTSDGTTSTTWGYISLDDNTSFQNLTDFSNNLHFGSVQVGTVNTAAEYDFVVQGATGDDFRYFQQFDHIINFNDSTSSSPDTILIGVPYALYNQMTSAGMNMGDYATMKNIEIALDNGVTVGSETTNIAITHPTAEFSTTATGDSASNDTLLSFDTTANSTTTTWGSILIHNDSIGGTNGNLVDFGNQLEIAAQGTAGSNTTSGVNMNFNVPDSSTMGVHDFSGFNAIEHIVDFSTSVTVPDTLTLTVNATLYGELGLTGSSTTGTAAVTALETGVAETGGAQNSQVHFVQNGTDLDINFINNTVTTGSIVLHNIVSNSSMNALNALQPHLVIAHS